MTDLRKAAQAVLDRWDSPQWEWAQQGPTADLMRDLRAALAQPDHGPSAVRSVVAKMRADLTAVGGFENGLICIPARGVRDYICDLEAALAQPDEVEQLRKNDARYQWLLNRIPGSAYRIAGVIYSEGGPGVDAAIDAAMANDRAS